MFRKGDLLPVGPEQRLGKLRHVLLPPLASKDLGDVGARNVEPLTDDERFELALLPSALEDLGLDGVTANEPEDQDGFRLTDPTAKARSAVGDWRYGRATH